MDSIEIPFYRLKYKIGFFFIIVFALLIRLYKAGHIYLTSDNVLFVHSAFDWIYRSPFAFDKYRNLIVGILAFPHGGINILLLHLGIKIFSLLNFPINEFIPLISINVLIIGMLFFVYQIGKEIGDRTTGFIASLFLSLMPVMVESSRELGIVHNLIASGLQIVLIYYFIIYCKRGRTYDAWRAGGFLSLYLLSDLLFIGIFPLLVYIAYIYAQERAPKIKDNLKIIRHILTNKHFAIIPVATLSISIAAYLIPVIFFNNFEVGILGHFLKKSKAHSFFIFETVSVLAKNCGGPILLIGFVASFYSVILSLRKERASIAFIWFLIYFLPIAIFVVPKSTVVEGYLMNASVALIFCVSNFLATFLKKYRFIGITTIVLTSLITSLITIDAIYGIGTSKFGPRGVIYDYRNYPLLDNGAKAAGYYIRKNIPLGKNVFTDFEPPIGVYYFGRPVFAIYDAPFDEIMEYFQRVEENVDVITIEGRNNASFLTKVGSFKNKYFKIATIQDAKKNPILYIYSKEKIEKELFLDLDEYNSKFNKEYRTIKKIVPNYNRWIVQNAPLRLW